MRRVSLRDLQRSARLTVLSFRSKREKIIRLKLKCAGKKRRIYVVPYGASINVKEGDYVLAGDNITKGPLNPNDILRLNGVEGVYQYLLKEVQRVYKNQGVDINDKHVEVIVSQMLSKSRIEDAGDTDLLSGGLYSKFEIEEANEAAIAAGGEPCTAKRVLLGITKASLATNSFLSAASFQETTKVLTDAAIKGKTDHLMGLKENVIIGKLIPAGTGMKRYRSVNVDYGINTELMESYSNMNYDESVYEVENDNDYKELAGMNEAFENDGYDIVEMDDIQNELND